MKKIISLIGIVAFSNFCLSQVPTTGLIAKWEFSGNLQDGVGTNNGTWQGAGNPVYILDRCGTPQSAIAFNGLNQFIQMAAAGISGSGARSLSFWMRTNNTTGGVRAMFNDGLFSPGPNAGTRWEVNHNYNCTGLGVDITMEYITLQKPCINDGRWHHVVATQAANSPLNTVSIYVDGNLVNTINCSVTGNGSSNSTIAQAITIGAVPAAPGGRFFQGALDDFYYYNVVLNSAQVAQLYYDKCTVQNITCGPPPPPPPTGCCLGNAGCTGANPLTSSWEIPLAGNKFIFSQAIGGAGRVGIGQMVTPCFPGNLLEVRRGATSSISGLRLTDLAGASPLTSNGNVLTVDANGDVILVPDGGCCVGNVCGGVANPIPAPGWEVPFGGNTYNFTKSAALSSAQNLASQLNVGFTSCLNNNPGRLNSTTDVHRFAGAFVNNNGFQAGFQCVGVGGRASSTQTNALGVRGEALAAPAGNDAVGVEGEAATISAARFNTGVQGFGSNGTLESAGGRFASQNSNSPENYGVKALAASGNPNANRDVGGLLSANVANPAQRSIGAMGAINTNLTFNSGAGINVLPVGTSIGVFGYNPQINPAQPVANKWAGYFVGDVRIIGSQPASSGNNPNAPPVGPYALHVLGNALTTAGAWYLSDRRYKDNVQPLENISEKIKKVSGYNYNYKTEEYKEKNFNPGRQIGLIAQEIKEVFPELVKEDSEGYLAVNYQGMIPVLLEAVKEQQKQIDEKTASASDIQKQLDDQKKINDELKTANTALNGRIDKLEQMINSCCAASSTGVKMNSQSINLSDKNVIVLNQNVPNPFAESTVITYNIPTDFTRAQINFITNDGKIIKTVEITTKGEGRLTVFANDLTNGSYTYTLIVDGKVIDSKKMVKD